MSDLSKLTKVLDEMGASYVVQQLSAEDARILARTCAEPAAAKTAKYILLGSSYLHFDFKGHFLGIECDSFEKREDNNGTGTDDTKADSEVVQEGTEEDLEVPPESKET